MNRLLTLVAAALLSAGAALAQIPEGSADPAPPQAGAPSEAIAPVEPGAAGGLPVGMGVPRTMRSYAHVFAAFTVTWLLLFGYTVAIGRRFRRLEAELATLSRADG